jgi:release factor glutamine methyltransferase
MPETVRDWQTQLIRDLTANSESPALDAQVLLAHVIGCSRSWVLAHPEASLSKPQITHLLEARKALMLGEPLPYVLGHWEFYGLDFLVTPDVLIPRPETELLVEQALKWLSQRRRGCQALEAGAGSGCISVSLAFHQPALTLIAVDISPPAIRVARYNADKYGVAHRINFVLSDLLSAIHGHFDLLCANLPYIPTHTLQGLSVVKHEPVQALDGGMDGLEIIRRFLQQAPDCLARDGLLLAEIEANQGQAVRKLAQRSFPQAQIGLLRDLSGNERLLRIENRL